MVRIYYNLVKAGRITIDAVDLQFRDEVQALLTS